MVEPADLNPLNLIGDFQIGGIGRFGTFLLIILIVFMILGGLIVLIALWYRNRQYKYTIPLFANVGNKPTRIGKYKAKPVSIGRAGDKLWFVKGVKKWIPPATIQSASNEFWHWVREDGEWINFSMDDLDEHSKKAGVHYIQQDMRSNRLATEKLLENTLIKKKFWEKYGMVIGYVVFFLLLSVAMVIIMYMFGETVEAMGRVIDRTNSLLGRADEILRLAKGEEPSGIVPALFMVYGKKWL